MRIPRIYSHQPLSGLSVVALPADTSHYLLKVLRLTAGRPLILFDGTNNIFHATLSRADKNTCEVQITGSELDSRESPLHTHLAVGISRGDRMDWVLQKATELGISEITPLFTERTEVKLKGERAEKKHQHWQQVLISACEQCGRNIIPTLNTATPFAQFEAGEADHKFVLHHRSSQALNAYSSANKVLLVTGPEGGLSDNEIDSLVEHKNFKALTLGPRILRTETAPLVALSAIQVAWGDLG